jgi:hypothetical protein
MSRSTDGAPGPAHPPTRRARLCSSWDRTVENGTCTRLFKQSFVGSSLVPTKLSLTAIHEHVDLVRTARRVQQDTGMAIPLPSYHQVRDYVRVLEQEPEARRAREQLPGPLRDRQSTRSFALSIPAPAQLAKGAMNIAWNCM